MRPDEADTAHHTHHETAWDHRMEAAADNGEYHQETTNCGQLAD